MASGMGEPWAQRFPDLFAPAYVDYADTDVTMTTAQVRPESVNRLHVVAVTDDGCVVVCGSDLGWRFLPGGRREAGEDLSSLLDRELAEEAGAARTGRWQIFASQVAHSRRAEPHLPHWSHPVGHWAYAIAPVRLVGPPTNVDDGEQVTEVLRLPPDEAARYLAQHDAVHADVVRLAAAMGLLEIFGPRDASELAAQDVTRAIDDYIEATGDDGSDPEWTALSRRGLGRASETDGW